MQPLVRKPRRLIPRSFYERPTLAVARDLLGAWICRRLPDGEEIRGRIVEVEAYLQGDPAAHGYRGPTPRNEVMFGRAGISYVYFIYGMYNCFNIVTESVGIPTAVLIRGLDRIDGANGPGRLCRELQLTRLDSGLDLTTRAAGVWLEQGSLEQNERIMVSPRIGLSVAQDLPWRYFVEGSPGVSKHPINRVACPEL